MRFPKHGLAGNRNRPRRLACTVSESRVMDQSIGPYGTLNCLKIATDSYPACACNVSANVCVTYAAAKPGRIDMQLINKAGATLTVLGGVTVDLPAADIGNTVVLSIGAVWYNASPGNEAYVIVYNDSGGTITLGDTDRAGNTASTLVAIRVGRPSPPGGRTDRASAGWSRIARSGGRSSSWFSPSRVQIRAAVELPTTEGPPPRRQQQTAALALSPTPLSGVGTFAEPVRQDVITLPGTRYPATLSGWRSADEGNKPEQSRIAGLWGV
jgi:hypothetical protein